MTLLWFGILIQHEIFITEGKGVGVVTILATRGLLLNQIYTKYVLIFSIPFSVISVNFCIHWITGNKIINWTELKFIIWHWIHGNTELRKGCFTVLLRYWLGLYHKSPLPHPTRKSCQMSPLPKGIFTIFGTWSIRVWDLAGLVNP